MRLFIALSLPKKERLRIERAARLLRDGDLPVRWVDTDSYHVTLKFLGPVRQERMGSIQDALERVAGGTKVFTMDLAGFGAFPTIRRPRTLWLGVEASPELRCLKQDVEWAMGDCGFETETRAFHPHVTLGRADDKGGAGAFRGLDDQVAGMAFKGSSQVRTLDLMESRSTSSGPRYSVLFSARLATS